jgi:hypothetical protein
MLVIHDSMFILTILDKEERFLLEQKKWNSRGLEEITELTVAVAVSGLLC